MATPKSRWLWARFFTKAEGSQVQRPLPWHGRPNLEALEDRVVPSTYDVIVNTDMGAGSGFSGDLRYCLAHAQGGDTIDFQISPLGTAQTITLSSNLGPLPPIGQSITIDGLSQGGGQTGPWIEVNGANVSGNGLTVNAGGVIIDGLAVDQFSGNGIVLNNPAGSAGDVLFNDNAGSGLSGTAAGVGNGGDGVLVYGGGNSIGGPGSIITQAPAPLPVSVWSGNAGNGVEFSGATASNNLLINSYVGVKKDGVTKLANKGSGVLAQGGANNTIGGAGGAGNVISGNDQNGVYFNNSSKNQVLGNTIGLGSDGSTAIRNGFDGILLENGSSNNTIGGSGAGNVISNNGGWGIRISATGANNNNLVAANLIGTDQTGAQPRGNANDGVRIEGNSTNNWVGSFASADGNVISSNVASGIDIVANGNWVVNNYIGTDGGGTKPLPNGTGVLLFAASNNTVLQNLISGNSTEGVQLTRGASKNYLHGNEIGTNAIGSDTLPNGGHGVEIDTFANNNTLDHNLISGNLKDGVLITGTNTANNTLTDNYIGVDASGTYKLPNSGNAGVEIADSASGNTVGGTTANLGNFISGNLGYGVFIQSGSASNVVAANYIGTDVNGTSPIPNSNGVYVSGDHNTIGGSVRGALNVISGNSRAGVDLYGSGATTNQVLGNNIGVGPQGNETTVGNGIWGVVIEAGASNNTIGGLQGDSTRNVISNNGFNSSKTTNTQGHGVYLAQNSTRNVIEGNYIGVDRANGNKLLGNAGDGIFIAVNANNNNTIGGTVAGAGNVISDNGGGGIINATSGIEIDSASNVVAANYIGVAADGLTALGNEGDGVLVSSGAANNTIGGTTALEGNVISANGNEATVGYGLDILGTGTFYDYDYIGYDSTGTVLVPNWDGGVNNLGTGTVPGTHNKIQPQ